MYVPCYIECKLFVTNDFSNTLKCIKLIWIGFHPFTKTIIIRLKRSIQSGSDGRRTLRKSGSLTRHRLIITEDSIKGLNKVKGCLNYLRSGSSQQIKLLSLSGKPVFISVTDIFLICVDSLYIFNKRFTC